MLEDLDDLPLGPAPLPALSDHQGRRINHAVFQPPQKGTFTNREQPGNCLIRQPISRYVVRRHSFSRNNTIKLELQYTLFGDKNHIDASPGHFSPDYPKTTSPSISVFTTHVHHSHRTADKQFDEYFLVTPTVGPIPTATLWV